MSRTSSIGSMEWVGGRFNFESKTEFIESVSVSAVIDVFKSLFASTFSRIFPTNISALLFSESNLISVPLSESPET